MTYTFTLANAKGGCGKTTVALNLAVCFARAGYRTLAIDLDQQGNLSAGLGVDLNKLGFTAHRLLISEVPDIGRYLVEIRPQLKLLPNSIDIEADDLLEAKKLNRELLLRRQMKPILPEFDVVLIDTPPAMRAATVNALVVADSVIIPIESSSFALLGMNQLLKTIAATISAPDDQQGTEQMTKRFLAQMKDSFPRRTITAAHRGGVAPCVAKRRSAAHSL